MLVFPQLVSKPSCHSQWPLYSQQDDAYILLLFLRTANGEQRAASSCSPQDRPIIVFPFGVRDQKSHSFRYVFSDMEPSRARAARSPETELTSGKQESEQ